VADHYPERKIIQETTDTLTLPLIGKGSKANYFQVGRNEVIVELVGFLHWIAENMNGALFTTS